MSAMHTITRKVRHVDNEGSACTFCGREGHVIECTIYLIDLEGNRKTIDTCRGCVSDAIAWEHEGDQDVIVEVATPCVK